MGFVIADNGATKMNRERGIGGAHKTGEDRVAQSTPQNAEVGGKREGHGDSELALVPNKNHLVTKAGQIGFPKILSLLTVVLGRQNSLGACRNIVSVLNSRSPTIAGITQ